MNIKEITDILKIEEGYLGKPANERLIEIVLRDKDTKQIIGTKIISKGQLARHMQPLTEEPVVGAYNGKFVIEI